MNNPIQNPFVGLEQSEVDTEQKGKFTYTSWPEAWRYAKLADPEADADFKKHTHKRVEDGVLVEEERFVSPEGFVQVETTILGISHTVQLPVKDNRNNSIEDPDSMEINTALMRCLAKSLALHGIGLHVYRGEDLPSEPVFSAKEVSQIRRRWEESDMPKKKLGEIWNAETEKDNPSADNIIDQIESYGDAE